MDAGRIPTNVMVGSFREFKELKDFFLVIPEIQVWSYHDKKEATVGFMVSRRNEEEDDGEISFSLRFAAKPSIVFVDMNPLTKEQLEFAESQGMSPAELSFDNLLLECLTKDGWIRADDPLKRNMGFAKYGRHASMIRYFRLCDVKSQPALTETINRWRDEHGESEFWQVAEKLLNVEKLS